MRAIDPDSSTLLVVDFQEKLLPAIEDGGARIERAKTLIAAAALLDIPIRATEQNAGGLGRTVEALALSGDRTFAKMTFDATRQAGFLDWLPAERPDLVVCGCEAHVCVQQTVLGLLDAGRRVHLVRDAVGTRRAEDRETAIARMARCGADIVTSEMVIFEWLGTAERPEFRRALGLVK